MVTTGPAPHPHRSGVLEALHTAGLGHGGSGADQEQPPASLSEALVSVHPGWAAHSAHSVRLLLIQSDYFSSHGSHFLYNPQAPHIYMRFRFFLSWVHTDPIFVLCTHAHTLTLKTKCVKTSERRQGPSGHGGGLEEFFFSSSTLLYMIVINIFIVRSRE